MNLLCFVLLFFSVYQNSHCAVWEKLLTTEDRSCILDCSHTYFNLSKPLVEEGKACCEGCRLFTVIRVAKDLRIDSKIVGLCEYACAEAFDNETFSKACSYGCHSNHVNEAEVKEPPTLHVVAPFKLVTGIYDKMAHRIKQFISTSWTVYVQEDNEKIVVVRASPKVVETLEFAIQAEEEDAVDPQQQARLDWMECLSDQAGIPRWLLVVVLFAFVFTLLWLCCATAVMAPSQYVTGGRKHDGGYIIRIRDSGYLRNSLNHKFVPVIPVSSDEEELMEAPPLPEKVPLI